MQRSTRIVVALVVGAWLGACSEPGSRTAKGTAQDPTGSARDVRLAEPPSPGAAVASDLETGRPMITMAAAASRPAHLPPSSRTAVEASAVVPRGLPTTESVELPIGAVALPESHTVYLAPTGEMEGSSPVNVAAGPSAGGEPLIGHDYGGSRGPSIIIRGGMGGVDDKCDLRPRGFGGMAINRMVPPMGGRNSRGGYTRGGIR